MNHWIRQKGSKEIDKRKLRIGVLRNQLLNSIGDDWVSESTLVQEHLMLHSLPITNEYADEVYDMLHTLEFEGLIEEKVVPDCNYLIDLSYFRKK